MRFRGFGQALAVATLIAAVGAGSLWAATPKQRRAKPAAVNRPARVFTTDISRRIDVNQINMFATNTGSFAFNLAAGDAGLFYPKGDFFVYSIGADLWILRAEDGAVHDHHTENAEIISRLAQKDD